MASGTAVVIKDIDEYYKLAEIIKVFHAHESAHAKPWMSLKDRLDKRHLAPHGYRTVSGYMLQTQSGHPVSLWTPWGALSLNLDLRVGWDRLSLPVLKSFSAKEAIAKCPDFIGSFGPVYSLHKAGSVKLPRVELLSDTKNQVERIGHESKTDNGLYCERYANLTISVWDTLCTHYCFAHKL